MLVRMESNRLVAPFSRPRYQSSDWLARTYNYAPPHPPISPTPSIMSTARWADWASMDNLTLLHTLVQSESAHAKYGSRPDDVTDEHKKELANLREEYKALFEGSRIQRADEWSYRYHVRQNVMDVWDIRTPPSLVLQKSGDVLVRSHTRPCHEGAAEESLITALCDLNDRLARFDLNKSLLTGSPAVPKILSPQAAACLTETRAGSLNLFDKLRDEYR